MALDSSLVPALILSAALLLPGCAHESTNVQAPAQAQCPYGAMNDGTQSFDLLCREPVANKVRVKHILVGWKELASPSRQLDPRADGRTYEDAQALARDLLQKLKGGEAIEPLMAQYSEDPGSALSGVAYDASPEAALVSEFKSLSLRLQLNEAGIVKTAFGLHIIQRVQ